MEVEIRSQNLHVDEATTTHVQRRMNFALEQFNSWITHVLVHLEDVNGPRRGIDKQCRILVNLKGGKTIKVEDLDVGYDRRHQSRRRPRGTSRQPRSGPPAGKKRAK